MSEVKKTQKQLEKEAYEQLPPNEKLRRDLYDWIMSLMIALVISVALFVFCVRIIDVSAPDCAAETTALAALPAASTIAVFNKCDLAPGFAAPMSDLPAGMRAVCVSAATGDGLDTLRGAIADALGVGTASDAGAVVNERHRGLLARADAALGEAIALVESGADGAGFDAVLAAQSLREAAEALGAILGRNVSEEVLDAVFSRFCVGK